MNQVGFEEFRQFIPTWLCMSRNEIPTSNFDAVLFSAIHFSMELGYDA